MKILLYASVLLVLAGCSKEINNKIPSGNSESEIRIDSPSYVFDSQGGSTEITFSSSEDWTAEILNTRADSWCTINPNSGPAGRASITITATDNDTPDDRNASIVLKAGISSQIINISQKQKDALTVTSSRFEVSSYGGEVTIEVNSNIDFEYSIEESAQEWINEIPSRATRTSTLKFQVAENEDKEKREGKISIISGDLNEIITIFQAGMIPEIIISQNEYTVSSASGTIAVEVTSNVDVEVDIPSHIDWIKENITRATSTNSYIFDISPNDNYDSRSAEIKFVNYANGISESLKVIQAQKDTIIVADAEYEIGLGGGTLDFEINANTEISITISENAVNWIAQLQTRGLYTERLCFDISYNNSDDSREGTIIISGGDASQTIRVRQLGKTETRVIERAALVEFYNATDGNNWNRNDYWCSDRPIEYWYGVGVTNGNVVRISLNNNNLTGQICESLGELSYLQELLLRNNKLSDEISHIISRLPYLITLDLSKNRLTGNLPDILDYMVQYDLSANLFTGSIPESHIKAFDKNQVMDFDVLQEEEINTEYGWYYNVSRNNLTGEVPDKMVNHPNWAYHWREILPQNPGYGFKEEVLKAPDIMVKCYDESFLDLGEEYRKNQYTIIFQWDPNCPYSQKYVTPIHQLYQTYKDDGLGLICTTYSKHTLEEIEPLTSVYKDIKVFWEAGTLFYIEDLPWNNNPCSLGTYFYLFRASVTPHFHIIDNFGNIIFYGSGYAAGETIPQYHNNTDDIFSFVADLFDDENHTNAYRSALR